MLQPGMKLSMHSALRTKRRSSNSAENSDHIRPVVQPKRRDSDLSRGDWCIRSDDGQVFHKSTRPKEPVKLEREVIMSMSTDEGQKDEVIEMRKQCKVTVNKDSFGVKSYNFSDAKKKLSRFGIDSSLVMRGGKGENEWEYIKEDLRWDDKFERISEKMHEYNVQQLNKAETETIIKEHGIPISQHDILTLTGLRWVNDQIIEFYLQMIAERSTKEDASTLGFPKVYTMNTYFFTRLCQGYSKIKNWTKKVDLFEYDLLVIPVHHQEMHWAVIVVDFRVPGVFYYDSLKGEDEEVIQSKALLSMVLNYLKDEHMNKKNEELDLRKYVKEVVDCCPQQENGSDCGLFVCKVVEYLSRDEELLFCQHDMPYFRQRMIWEIGKNTLKTP